MPEAVFIGEFVERDPESDKLRVAIKDNIDVKGVATTVGSLSTKDRLAAFENAPVVEALNDDAALYIGKTNLDEFACGSTGVNPWFGTVQNPIDPSRIIGGSSGGSAAAVARDYADMALGTDTGGSVRIPAALAGLYGLKTTKGLLSTAGVHPLSELLDVVGPLTRDLPTMKRAMRLLHPQNTSRVGGELAVGRIRFDEPETAYDQQIDQVLSDSGANVEPVHLRDWLSAHYLTYTLIAHGCWHNNERYVRRHPKSVGAAATAVIGHGAAVTETQLSEALRFRAHWTARIESLFERYDVLVCPTLAYSAPAIGEADAIAWESYSRTMPFSMSGHPALNIPLPAEPGVLPAGMQVIGGLGKDFNLLEAAQELVLGSSGGANL